MSAPTCTDCPAPATVDVDAGRRRIGDHWIARTLPLCAWCAARDAQERAEKAAS